MIKKKKVHAYGGATSKDMNEMVKIAMRREPDVLIVHSGTNDFEHKVNAKTELEQVIKYARSQNSDVKIAISSICHREDKKELIPKVKDMNNQLKIFCAQNHVGFIDNKNFTSKNLSY